MKGRTSTPLNFGREEEDRHNMSQKRPADGALSGSVPKSSRTVPTTSTAAAETAAAETGWRTTGQYMHRRVFHTVTYQDGLVRSGWARVTAWLPEQGHRKNMWRVEFEKHPYGAAVQELELLDWSELEQAMFRAALIGGGPPPSAPARTTGLGGLFSTDEWYTHGSAYLNKRVLYPFAQDDGSHKATWAVVTAWLPAYESKYKDDHGKNAALWRIAFEVADFNGCPNDLIQDLEEHELLEAITTTEKYLSINLCGGPPPSAPARTAGSGGCASSASAVGASSASAAGASSAAAAGSRAFPEGNVKVLQIVKKRNDAELTATTFEKITVDKEVFRCYLQVFHTNKPWDEQKYPWLEMVQDDEKIKIADNCCLLIHPFVDPQGKVFKMEPEMVTNGVAIGNPTIRDYDGCGVVDLPISSTIQWQFDRLVNYTCGDVNVSFIVVKIPGTPPPTIWNPKRKAEPADQTQEDVEKLVRAKFFIRPERVMTQPCWFGASIIENECSMYTWAFIETEKKRKELSIKHLGLMKEHSALSDENIAIMNKNISMETDSQSTAKAFKDIRESMTCAICLEIFDDEKAAMIGSCGHVLHQKCLQNQQPTMGDVCPSCRHEPPKKKSWQKFTGYTGIATALKNLETERGAQ